MALQEYDLDHRTFQNPTMEDGRLYAVFFRDVLEDKAASLEAGRPIFKDTEFVRIVAPGDKTNVVVRPAREDDKLRFSRQYEAFKRGDAEQIVGTPLAQWPAITRAQAEEFRYFGILTVEHLAELRDEVKLKMPGAMELSRRARAWLDAAAGNDSRLAKAEAENAELRARLERLESKLLGADEEDSEEDAVAAAAASSPTKFQAKPLPKK